MTGISIPTASRKLLSHQVVFGILVLVGFMFGAIPVFLGVLNHDVAWLLYVAGRVWDGATLNVDVVEINPPLIVWLNLPPILLARALGISSILTFRLMVLALLGASLVLSGRVLRRTLPGQIATRRALLLLLLFLLLPLVHSDFGQREHLMLALILPYLLAASARASGCPLEGRLPWLLGVMAGVGIALKPYFVPLWVAIEVYLAGRRRGERTLLRPECLAIVGVGVVYAGAVLGLDPEYLGLVRTMRQAYAGYFHMPLATLLNQKGVILSGVAVLGYAIVRPGGAVQGLCPIVLLADASFLGAVIIQGKGWPYHYYPVNACAVLLLGLLVLAMGKHEGRWARVSGAVFGGLLLAFALGVPVEQMRATLQTWGRPEEAETPLGRMIRLTRSHAESGSIYVMSDLLPDAFPLVNYSDVRWASRFPSLWILPGLYRGGPGREGAILYRPRDSASYLERYLIDAVVSDLRRDLPALLIVDVTPRKPRFEGRRFDYLEYFSRDPRFAALIQEYEPLTDLDTFRVYQRRPARMMANRP